MIVAHTDRTKIGRS